MQVKKFPACRYSLRRATGTILLVLESSSDNLTSVDVKGTIYQKGCVVVLLLRKVIPALHIAAFLAAFV